jgi:hypothetical protein
MDAIAERSTLERHHVAAVDWPPKALRELPLHAVERGEVGGEHIGGHEEDDARESADPSRAG